MTICSPLVRQLRRSPGSPGVSVGNALLAAFPPLSASRGVAITKLVLATRSGGVAFRARRCVRGDLALKALLPAAAGVGGRLLPHGHVRGAVHPVAGVAALGLITSASSSVHARASSPKLSMRDACPPTGLISSCSVGGSVEAGLRQGEVSYPKVTEDLPTTCP